MDTQSEARVSGSTTQRYYQVVPAGESPRSNGVWGVIRTTIPSGFGLFGVPLLSDRDFGGEFGTSLAARLTSGDLDAGDGDGDEVYIRQPNGDYIHLLLTTAYGWYRTDLNQPYTDSLLPGQGIYILRNGSTVTDSFSGAVGNMGQLGLPSSTNVIYEGYNIVSFSEGRLVSIQDAFSDTISGDPYASNDEQAADQLILQEPNGTGTWHRYFYGTDNKWHDILQPGFPVATGVYLRPGQAYFYLRRSGQGTITTRY